MLIDHVRVEGFRIGINVSGVGKVKIGANKHNERIILRNSEIINNYEHGWFGGGPNIVIEDNLFENNGENSVFDHNVYLNSPGGIPIANVTIKRNTLYRSAIVDGKCQGVSLVVHGHVDNLTIEDNLIKEDKFAANGGCWGISVDPGYTSEEEFHNITIKNNRLLNVGGTAIGCASCKGVLIESNVIIDESGILQRGIAVPVREEDSLKSENVKIYSNTITLTHDNSSGVYIGGSNKFDVKSNIISRPLGSGTEVPCIEKKGLNTGTNTDANTCKFHTETPVADEVQVEAAKVNEILARITERREPQSGVAVAPQQYRSLYKTT